MREVLGVSDADPDTGALVALLLLGDEEVELVLAGAEAPVPEAESLPPGRVADHLGCGQILQELVRPHRGIHLPLTEQALG